MQMQCCNGRDQQIRLLPLPGAGSLSYLPYRAGTIIMSISDQFGPGPVK